MNHVVLMEKGTVSSDVAKKRVLIVGGGPVGALNAIFVSRLGFHVDLYEQRTDIRKEDCPVGRSINLALSVRGISALRHAGLDERITAMGVPMNSRYIHTTDGATYTIPYGKTDQRLLSIDRLELNRELLSAASKCPNVSLHFEHKLMKCEPENTTALFLRPNKTEVQESGFLLIGCDGAYSRVRSQMTRSRMNYSQSYIPHGYKELTILPNSNGEYAIPPNHLHIWPRGNYMLIALPNLDCSFTCTLFMPFDMFDALETGEDVLKFFKATFSDAVPLIGERALSTTFFDLKPLPMISVKCSPFHCKDSAVIMGDAAHAVVPFYGQGLNCGLEDALIFDGIMEDLQCELCKVLPRFSAVRVKAAHAIADLSKSNYEEMRSHVSSTWFLFRKKVDNLLHFFFPSTFIPKYSMVAFTRISYEEVIRRSKKQNKIVDFSLTLLGVTAAAVGIAWAAWKSKNGYLSFSDNFVCRRILNMTEK